MFSKKVLRDFKLFIDEVKNVSHITKSIVNNIQ